MRSFAGAILVGMLLAAPARATPAEDKAFFESKIRPILHENCFRCHGGGPKKEKGGLSFKDRATLLRGGDSGPAVVPGETAKSLLIKAVHYYEDLALQMPPQKKLSDRDVSLLEEWVKRGAWYPGDKDTATTKVGVDLTEARKFWSFQPLKKSPAPATKKQGWSQRGIDSFLLAEMEAHNLEPSAPASRRVLIRRATFDLLGLPPTPDEVAAFEKDDRPDAYAKLIDRLLSSPQHGERWGRFWLDLTRYADIGEQWMESKGKAYHYRDWVVRAINDDVPYDRFLRQQLAADLVPDSKPGDRAALGFLGLSPSYWKELKLAPDVIQTVVGEEWEERIQAVTSTFLGLTVACARCHDHKFDPITTEDYYGLAGVIASTRLVDRALMTGAESKETQDARDKVKLLTNEISKVKSQKDAVDKLRKQIDDLKKTFPGIDAPMVPGVDDASLYVLADGPHKTKLEYKPGVALDVAVQIRGNPTNLGPIVPRRFLGIFAAKEPRPMGQGSGRLELANALVEEAGPLTARVIVNRVWRHHFGKGLVETPSDFGTQGDRPTHPQLLDDLAARFIDNGWSLKWLHREVMLSATYQQASTTDARRQAIDPDNRWLSRMCRRRLEVEAWRDAMLAATGTLQSDIGGPSLDLGDAKNLRRTLYGTVKRRELNDMLRLHDFPDPTSHSPSRVPTITPLQQLFTLNSPLVQQQAAALVKRLHSEAKSDEERIRRAYWLLFARPATPAQVELGLGYLRAGNEAWTQYAQVLLGSNEFLFVD